VADPNRFGEIPLIADTSVWAKLRYAPRDLVDDFGAAARAGLILGSTIVSLEFLHDAKSGAAFDIRDAAFSALRTLPVTRAVSEAAMSGLRDLRAAGADGYHRVGLADALIAATAQENSVNVLHDNPPDFDKLAEVMAFTPVRFGPIP
jgi:predicted nucleic acid-binding protein